MPNLLKMGKLMSQAAATLNQATRTLAQMESFFKEAKIALHEAREEEKKRLL